jgi:glyoxylase-like metal-dependent hydrolase (beta-lactamase superfamily II)
MHQPIMLEPRRVAADTDILPAYFPLPGLGVLPVNAFLIHGDQPLLVDTGLPVFEEAFVDQLRTRIDLEALRWIWLTHADPDHVGALARLLREAPNAQLITTYLGMGKLGLTLPVAPERVFLLNPTQSLELGDRRLDALRPPTYDAPETTALFDTKTGALFSADAFGALMREPAEEAAAIGAPALTDGQVVWATIDAPWLHLLEAHVLEHALRAVRTLSPSIVLSAHLPPARNMTDTLLANLAAARSAPEFVGPDQEALIALLAS